LRGCPQACPEHSDLSATQEGALDRLVYQVYGLTEAASDIIHWSLWICSGCSLNLGGEKSP
jgi:hypothetical protein